MMGLKLVVYAYNWILAEESNIEDIKQTKNTESTDQQEKKFRRV